MSRPDYQLIRSARRTLAIQIRQDGRVEVRAPRRLPLIEIETFVASRADWIRRHLDEIAARPLPPALSQSRVWPHLGEFWQLVEGQGGLSRTGVRACNGTRTLTLATRFWQDDATLRQAVLRWQQREAADWLTQRVDDITAGLDASWQPSGLGFRHMRTRWGSCSRERRISLNTALMQMPPECIDYVIWHELCHLHEFNHGPRFYALQQRVCPDWAERKARLERLARQMPGGGH